MNKIKHTIKSEKNFTLYLKKAAEEVKSWPIWKQTALGISNSPDTLEQVKTTNCHQKVVKNSFDKKWDKRVLRALSSINKIAKKQKHEAEYTADDKKLKIGLKVYVLDDPTVLWTVSEIDEKIYKRRATLETKGRETIKRYPIKLFCSQKKAVNACIEDIKRLEAIVLRDMRENLNRLDANNRINQLKKLKKKL